VWVSEGGSVFVWGAREAEIAGYLVCRASITLTITPPAHADRAPQVATAHATARASRAPRAVFSFGLSAYYFMYLSGSLSKVFLQPGQQK
jgi:hypothetical protein